MGQTREFACNLDKVLVFFEDEFRFADGDGLDVALTCGEADLGGEEEVLGFGGEGTESVTPFVLNFLEGLR